MFVYKKIHGALRKLIAHETSPIQVCILNNIFANLPFITCSVFAAMSIYGYTTKRDLTKFGSFLMMGLIGIIIASVVNIFMKSTMMEFVISCIGVLVFVGLTAYDTQKIKSMYYSTSAEMATKTAIMGALTLYLDFINLFLMLLRLFGQRR